MPRSGSASTPPRRLLGRGARARPLVDSDLRWLWAAYQLGAWRELMDAGLSRDGFTEKMLDVVAAVPHDWILEARGAEGLRPVGLVLARSFGAGRCLDPHVDWFEWASPRNKVEALAAFFRDAGRDRKILIFSPEPLSEFWGRFTRWRMLTRGGQVVDYFAVGEHARLFYTRGP